MLLNQLFQLLNLEPRLGQRMLEERQDGGLVIRAQRQPRVSEPRDVSNQRVHGVVRRVHSLLRHDMREDGLAKGVFCHQNRDGGLGSSCDGAPVEGFSRLIQMEIIEREDADVSSIFSPSVLLAGASGANAFAAPASKRNVPRGTKVFRLGLSGLMGSREKFCGSDLGFGVFDCVAFDQASSGWRCSACVAE